MATEIPTNRREFEAALQALLATHARIQDNPASYRSDGERCYECMFTTGSRDCYKCTYCSGCSSCTNCTHCRECAHVHASSYCVQSSNLSGCSYVVLSQNCYDCVFCFGCVGLVKKEFHILNQPFKRDMYFKIVAKLEAAFGLKRAA